MRIDHSIQPLDYIIIILCPLLPSPLDLLPPVLSTMQRTMNSHNHLFDQPTAVLPSQQVPSLLLLVSKYLSHYLTVCHNHTNFYTHSSHVLHHFCIIPLTPTAMSLGDQKGKYFCFSTDLCALFWFYRFLEGCKKGRMGQDWRPNQALSMDLLLKVLSETEALIDGAEMEQESNCWIVVNTYITVCYVVSLCGS
jgi:hypothetical protein